MTPIPKEDYDRAIKNAKRIAQSFVRRYAHAYWIDKDVFEATAIFAVYKAAQKYNGEKSQFVTYAYTVCRNSISEEIRVQSPWKRKQMQKIVANVSDSKGPEAWMLPAISYSELELASSQDEFTEPEELDVKNAHQDFSEQKDTEIYIREALAKVDPKRRVVLVLMFYYNYTEKMIAPLFKVSESRIHSWKYEGLTQMYIFLHNRDATQPIAPLPVRGNLFEKDVSIYTQVGRLKSVTRKPGEMRGRKSH
jgi:RNA polymerase sigma factor (sigma-70 family)